MLVDTSKTDINGMSLSIAVIPPWWLISMQTMQLPEAHLPCSHSVRRYP
jgi:hypothetical protein